jgi:hypothetical protein
MSDLLPAPSNHESAHSWGHLNLRRLIWPVAVFFGAQAMSHYQEKGYFGWIPDWAFDIALVLAFLLLIYWAWTQDDVQKWCRLLYNRSRKMLLWVLISIGACIGAMVGAFGWWTIHRQEQLSAPSVYTSNTEAAPKETPQPSASALSSPEPTPTMPTPQSTPAAASPSARKPLHKRSKAAEADLQWRKKEALRALDYKKPGDDN